MAPLLAFLLTVALSSSVAAATVSIEVTGSVIELGDEGGLLDGSVSLGSALHGHIQYDDAASPSSSTADYADWQFLVPESELSFSVGDYQFAPGPLGGEPGAASGFQIFLGDGPGSNSYYVVGSILDPLSDGSSRAFFGLLLTDSTGAALSSTDLSAVPFVVSAWDDVTPGSFSGRLVQISFEAADERVATIIARIDGLQASRAVPEPAAPAVVMLALAAAGSWRSRRSARK